VRNSQKVFAGVFFAGVLLFCVLIFYASRDDSAFRESSADVWAGAYEFFEYALPMSDGDHEFTWKYRTAVYEDGRNLTADIAIDGFLTEKRYRARVTGDGDEISFVFEEYLPGNVLVFDSFEKGDLLLRFVKNGENIDTVWCGIQPNTEVKSALQFKRIAEEQEAQQEVKSALQFKRITEEQEAQQEERNETAEKQFKMQTVKFLRALRMDSVEALSQLVLNDSFRISRIFTFGNIDDARGESVTSQRIDLKDISSLNFPIGGKNQLSDLNARFFRLPERNSRYEPSPLKVKSTDAFYTVGKFGSEILEQCDSLIEEYGSDFVGDVIIRVGENGFVFAMLQGSWLAFSDWAYFEKVGDSFYLKSVFLFY
jgi:hypothetical protein